MGKSSVLLGSLVPLFLRQLSDYRYVPDAYKAKQAHPDDEYGKLSPVQHNRSDPSTSTKLKSNRRKETQREHTIHEEIKFDSTELQALPGQENISYIKDDKDDCQSSGYLGFSLCCNHSFIIVQS